MGTRAERIRDPGAADAIAPPLPSAPRRVALVAHRYPPAVGGVERHVGELARGLVARGIEVEVVTTDPAATLPAEERVDGVLVHRRPTLGGDATFYLAPGVARWLVANAARFDVIHAHSYHTPLALAALAAARLAGRPFVLTPHYHGTGHSPLARLLHVPYRPFGGLIVRGSRPLICVSAAERTSLQRDFGESVQAVIAPNGVDVDEIVGARPFEPGSADALLGRASEHARASAPPDEAGREDEPRRSGRVILVAGRLESYKGVDRVVEALGHLPADDALVVIGRGPAEAELATLAQRTGVGSRVLMLGHVPTPELHRWLRTADVFVSMSRHEAFGITILEAAAGGAGLVASGIPAHLEVAGYLPAGWTRLVPVDATASEIADAIASTGRRTPNPGDLDRIPRWSDTVDRTVGAYAVALSRRSGAPAA